jgi:hypothetical protein
VPAIAEEMYKCQICGQTSEPCQPAHKLVIETRPVRYSIRKKEQPPWKIEPDGRTKYKIIDNGGMGRECVKEITVCGKCHERVSAL